MFQIHILIIFLIKAFVKNKYTRLGIRLLKEPDFKIKIDSTSYIYTYIQEFGNLVSFIQVLIIYL